MPKNADLKKALETIRDYSGGDVNWGNDAIEALSPILKAGKDPKAFRKAVISSADFFNKINPALDIKKDQKDDDDTFLEEKNAANTIESLFKLAVQARVQLVIPFIRDEKELESIITAADENTTRVELEKINYTGFKAANITGGINDEDALTNKATDEIKLAAQKELILRKIRKAADVKLIEKLLASTDNASFINAAKDLGVSATAADKMKPYKPLFDLIKSEAALKVIQKSQVKPKSAEDLKALEVQLKTNNLGTFLQGVGVFLNAEDELKAKASVGKKYLNQSMKLATRDNINYLIDLAKNDQKEDLLRLLGDDATNQRSYLKQALTPEYIKNGAFRHIAARRAVRFKIAESNDVEALKKLAEASDISTVQKVLSDHPSFGFAGSENQKLRDVLAMNPEDASSPAEKNKIIKRQKRTLNLIAGAAHVQYSVLTGVSTNKTPSADNLKSAIASSSPYGANFLRLFPCKSKDVEEVVKTYLQDPEHIKQARETALVQYFRESVKTLDHDKLVAIFNAKDLLNLKKVVTDSLGGNFADDLLDKTSLMIRGYSLLQMGITKVFEWDKTLERINAQFKEIDCLKDIPQADQDYYKAKYCEKAIRFANATNPGPDYIKKLTAIANAKTPQEFKNALTAIDITSHEWINGENQASIQKTATEKVLSELIDNAAPYEKHDALKTVLNKLSASKQQELIANPHLINRLTKAESKDEIRDLLKITSKTDLENIENENKMPLLLSKIHNAELANLLKRLIEHLPNNLSASNIDEINRALMDCARDTEGVLLNTIILRQKLSNIINNESSRQAISGALQSSLFGDIKRQDNFNKQLRAKRYPTTQIKNSDRALTDFLLPLAKTKEFTVAQYDELVKEIKASKNRGELIQKIEANATLKGNLPPTFEQNLTPNNFNEIKQKFKQEKILAAGTNTASELSNEVKQVKELQNKTLKPLKNFFDDTSSDTFIFSAKPDEYGNVNRKIRHELRDLAIMSSADWLTPIMGAKAKQNAERLGPLFKELDQECEILITYLRRQKKILEDMKAGLPTDQNMKSVNAAGLEAVQKHRKNIEENLKIINQQLAYYEPVQQMLRPDPESSNEFRQKGLLAMMDEAKKGDKVIRFKNASVRVESYPATELKAHQDTSKWKSRTAEAGPAGRITTAADTSKFEIVDKVAPDHFNEFAVTYDIPGEPSLTSTFTEQYGPKDLAVEHKDFKTKVSPQVNYDILNFQLNAEPKPGEEAKFNCDMQAALIMAREVIANAAKTGQPITIRGNNEYYVKMLWSAVMVMKDIGPGKALRESDIKVDSAYFNPKSQYNLVGRIKSDSMYHKFKESPAFVSMKQGMTELQQAKAVADKKFTAVSNAGTELAKRFKDDKNGLKTAISQMATENKNADDAEKGAPAPRP